jgi:hypothetical protein
MNLNNIDTLLRRIMKVVRKKYGVIFACFLGEREMKDFNKKALLCLISIGLLFFAVSLMVFSHCQIPCGIYDDQARLDMMAEHIGTIEKSINQVNEISA